MALDVTVGGASSDSYVSLAEAATYFGARFGTDAWDALSDANKEKALKQATREVDSHLFLGRRNYWSQALQFPRAYPYHREEPRQSTAVEIPTSVKHATCEQALFIVQHATTGGRSPIQSLRSEGVVSHRVGSLAQNFEGATQGVLGPGAKTYLTKWITRWGQIDTDDRSLSLEDLSN